MADYLYGSANVRALETAIVGRDRIARLLEAKTAEDAYGYLSEYGVSVIYRDGTPDREATLLSILREAYGRVAALAPDSPALLLWRYPYDCNNVKAAIKCRFRGIDPAPMLFDFGTVLAEDVVEMARTGSFSGLPEALRVGAEEAEEAFAKTKNPQVVDLILDRACYREMLRAARASGNAYVQRLVVARIDLTNILTLLRILRMRSGEAGERLLADALLEGGILTEAFFSEMLRAGEEALLRALGGTPYDRFATVFGAGDRSLTCAERTADNLQMEIIRETRFIPVGLEVMVAFLLGHEYEVRNLRIILSGKEAGISTQTIRERIRESYV